MIATDIAWAAGFIDGEGCISIMRHKVAHSSKPGHLRHNDCYTLHLSLSQVTTEALEKLQTLFGGTVRQAKGKTFDDPSCNKSPAWFWRCSLKNVVEVLESIYPYAIVKRREIEVALRFAALPRWRKRKEKRPEELTLAYEALFNELRDLKPRMKFKRARRKDFTKKG